MEDLLTAAAGEVTQTSQATKHGWLREKSHPLMKLAKVILKFLAELTILL